MTPIKFTKLKILDGERIFRMYFTDMGSARSITKVKKQLGEYAINSRTGREVTDMAIWFCLWRWAMEHLDLSYEIFNSAMLDQGEFYSKQDWVDTVHSKASVIMKRSERKFSRWQNRIAKRIQTNA